MDRAKVLLVKAETYTLKGYGKFKKNVSVIVKGAEKIALFENNGHFSVTNLEPSKPEKVLKKKKKKKKKVSEPVKEDKKDSSVKKKKKKKKKLNSRR